ncbi:MULTISPECIES: NRDE family protein [unclassified Novosphingobium]|uniref:NRDE family protein n=1 Tax=unclassified Novosphingobium TaxID=2644732 RepID=UPI0025D9AB3F|nr:MULTISPECIES: NRDE family protein [unclassified Novosphingobium]HQV03715.1 NRDE family protein [Novosphingobium sp.]
MCVAAIAWRAHPRWPLVAIGNRDEFHERPTAPLAEWADGRIIAGRDLQAGGTWLGVAQGRFGLVTNLRVPGYPRPELASRGALVTDWLRGNAPAEIETMNPFNLWLVDQERLQFVSNHPVPEHMELEAGIHGLSNGAHGDRWFKTARLEAALAEWFATDAAPEVLFDALADRTPQSADPEDAFSSVFIRNPTYGTRCSTVVLVDAQGYGRITERRFDASGERTEETALQFGWPV